MSQFYKSVFCSFILFYFNTSLYSNKKICIEFELIAKERKLNSNEILGYGDCLSTYEKYQESYFEYKKVFKKKDAYYYASIKKIIYLYGNYLINQIDLKIIMDSILQQHNSIHMRYIELLINRFLKESYFEGLHKILIKYPHLFKESYISLAILNLNKKKFVYFLQSILLNKDTIQYYLAQYYFTYKDINKSLNILTNLLNKDDNIKYILLKANIYWETNQKIKSSILLNQFKNSFTHYKKIADFYFKKGNVDKSLQIIREAIEEGFNLYYLEIFYVMSQSRFVEAAYLLEKYYFEKKIPFYYHNLKKDFFQNGSLQDYWQGYSKLLKDYPSLCIEALKYQIDFDSNHHILKSIKKCKELQQVSKWHSFLYLLNNKKKYSLLNLLLVKKRSRTLTENYYYAKTLFILKKDIMTASIILKEYTQNKNTLYSNDAYKMLSNIALKKKDYQKAIQYFKQTNRNDAYLIWLYIYANQLDKMFDVDQFEINGIERKFFKAIWYVFQGEIQTTINLLDEYVQNPGEYANQALSYLFILKYFEQEKKSVSLLKDIIQFPFVSIEKYKSVFNRELNHKINNDFSIFIHYWYARLLLDMSKKKEAINVLKKILNFKKSLFLKDESKLLLLSTSKECIISENITCSLNTNEKKMYQLEFPDTPLQILIK